MSKQVFEKQEIQPGEWHDVLWHQYMNCVDSLHSQSAESQSIPGMGPIFRSHPSLETFDGNVIILEAMCEGYGLIDQDYQKKIPEGSKKSPRDTFSALTDLLKRKGVWKEDRPYLGRV
jgi:hypothetical protein